MQFKLLNPPGGTCADFRGVAFNLNIIALKRQFCSAEFGGARVYTRCCQETASSVVKWEVIASFTGIASCAALTVPILATLSRAAGVWSDTGRALSQYIHHWEEGIQWQSTVNLERR
ncbi:hypothetical protein DPEC_G00113790 [Dallia pectoralis]|uniref:Uncharacterized protein n=1 Tax=Dallia pectoralis TaxID=75939 RepID=A0ACC2GTT6_DALPE|nr:hypothetical protein DPEC_G00113790 [Dallia pectoralis]